MNKLREWIKNHKVFSQGMVLMAVVIAFTINDMVKERTLPLRSGIQLASPNSKPIDTSAAGLPSICELWNHNGIPGNPAPRDSSARCLGCHDGSVGKLIPTHASADAHPSGVRYPMGSDYHPVSQLGSVVLVNGNIECVSCHDGSSKSRNHIVVTQGKHLCQACHNK